MSEIHPADRDYDEREVALILKRAVEMQDGLGEGQQRLTLGDVQQIAREVGIDGVHVARAAETLEQRPIARGRSVLGAPTTLQTSLAFDRELSDAEVGEMLDLLRSAVGLQGATSQGLDTVEWAGRDSVGGYYLSVSRRAGSTRLRLSTQRSDQAAVVVAVTGVAGMIGLSIAASLFNPESAGGIWALFAGTGVATLGSARFLWQRVARRWDARLRDLAVRLRSSLRAAPDPREAAGGTPGAYISHPAPPATIAPPSP